VRGGKAVAGHFENGDRPFPSRYIPLSANRISTLIPLSSILIFFAREPYASSRMRGRGGPGLSPRVPGPLYTSRPLSMRSAAGLPLRPPLACPGMDVVRRCVPHDRPTVAPAGRLSSPRDSGADGFDRDTIASGKERGETLVTARNEKGAFLPQPANAPCPAVRQSRPMVNPVRYQTG